MCMAHFIEIPAATIENWLRGRGFTRMAVSGERTFERPGRVCPSLRLVVWTSVPEEGGPTRALGKDAIRVALVAVVGIRRWPLWKGRRIHRTTSVDSVLDRIKERLLEGAVEAKKYGKPCARIKADGKPCGAPTYADSGRCIDRACRESAVIPPR